MINASTKHSLFNECNHIICDYIIVNVYFTCGDDVINDCVYVMIDVTRSLVWNLVWNLVTFLV